MSRFVPLIVWVLLSACATARPEKMSFAEAFGTRTPEPLASQPASTARVTPSLDPELRRFADDARRQRLRSERGSAMPAEHQARWARLLEAVDLFLDRPLERTALAEVERARAALGTELEQDARTYGDFPAQLAEQVVAQRDRLSVRVALLRPRPPAPAPAPPRFGWPIDPVVVTSPFGVRVHPVHGNWKEHAGIDLDAYSGQLVTAAGEGVVVRAGWNGGHGRQVEVRHAGGVITRYSHLSAVLVEPGTRVVRGDPVGLAGRSGLATGVHLHFEIWRDGQPEDPLELLSVEDDVPRS